MAKRNQSQRGASRSSWQGTQNYRNAGRQDDHGHSESNAGYKQAYESDYPDYEYNRNYHRGNSYDISDRDYNHDIRSGLGTGSYHGGSYEGGYSNSDYRDNDRNQRYNEGHFNPRNDRYGNYDYDRGFSRDYNQSRFGQGSTYGMYEDRGTSDRYDYNTQRHGSGGSHFSSDNDRRGQFGPSFNRNTEGSSRWEHDREWGQHSAQGFRGKGPKGYQRSDERIREDINDHLSDSNDVDATEIEVAVKNGEVTLTGTVESRSEKRRAEDIVESVSGVKNVENRIRLNQQGSQSTSESGRSTASRSGSNGNKTRHTSMSES